MRLGPKEKQILRNLIPGQFIPPSVYLEVHNSCPSGNRSLQRIVYDKKLAVFRYQTQTPDERKQTSKKLTPGYNAAEFYAALMLTPKGEEAIAQI